MPSRSSVKHKEPPQYKSTSLIVYSIDDPTTPRYRYGFITLSAVKRWVDAVIDDQPFKWISTTQLSTPYHIIECDKLEDIMEYKYKGNEATRQLPFDLPKRASVSNAPSRKTSAPKTTRAIPSDYVSIAFIAKEANMTPSKARQLLRKRTVKPACGWAWPKTEAKEIISKLKEPF